MTNSCMAGDIYLGEGERLVAHDTIPLKAYQAVEYFKCDSEGHNTSIGNVIIIYRDKKEVMSIDEGGTEVSNICAVMTPESAGYIPITEHFPGSGLVTTTYVKKSDTCYIGDVNGDSIDEIIIETFTGGANCCFTTRICALKDTLELLLFIDVNLQSDEIIDINGDSIPEVLSWDNRWAFWRDETNSYKAYLPPIIWRWDGKKYRIANFKFADYLIKKFNLNGYKPNPIDSIAGQFECNNEN